jgi:MFS family permease
MNDESTKQTVTPATKASQLYAWYVLAVLVLVYVFNFIDRQILSILAEEIKADLGIGDAEIGFLYGTAFAVFYAVFGVPLGRLADLWTRRTLIAIGLAFWSAMTALSGTSRGFGSLAAYRIGVGIGESSASPAAFSMLGDYFPPKFRATAVAIYSSGVYIGSGIGLFIGGFIVDGWADAFPAGDAPLGLKGWHVAFFAVGLPGLIMALWVWTLREPTRGQMDGIPQKVHPAPFWEFGKELLSVLPIVSLFSLYFQGASGRIFATNFALVIGLALGAWGLTELTGSWLQWTALTIGVYSVASWIQALAIRDLPTFRMIYASPTMVCGMAGFACIGFVTYGVGFWVPPFVIRAHGVDAGQAGMYLGIAAAVGGWLGVTLGGVFSDWLKHMTPRARPLTGFVCMGLTVPVTLFVLNAENVKIVYLGAGLYNAVSAMWIGSAVALATELVLPRMRASATAFYILMVTFIGLALGPYTMGQISDFYIRNEVDPASAIRNGMVLGLLIFVIASAFLVVATVRVTDEERNRMTRAREAGEEGLPE